MVVRVVQAQDRFRRSVVRVPQALLVVLGGGGIELPAVAIALDFLLAGFQRLAVLIGDAKLAAERERDRRFELVEPDRVGRVVQLAGHTLLPSCCVARESRTALSEEPFRGGS